MAAPAATPRVTPAGIRLKNGHSTKVTFAADPDVSLWEISVKPFSFDGGDPISTKTMFTQRWASKAFRTLIDCGDATMECAYDPAVITQLIALINVETVITFTFPDGSTAAFYGGLRVAEFGELVEGEMPTCSVTLTATNADSAGVEQGPVVVSVAGT